MYWVEPNESVLLKDVHWDRLMEEGQPTARCASKQVAPLGLPSSVPSVSCVRLCVPPCVHVCSPLQFRFVFSFPEGNCFNKMLGSDLGAEGGVCLLDGNPPTRGLVRPRRGFSDGPWCPLCSLCASLQMLS